VGRQLLQPSDVEKLSDGDRRTLREVTLFRLVKYLASDQGREVLKAIEVDPDQIALEEVTPRLYQAFLAERARAKRMHRRLQQQESQENIVSNQWYVAMRDAIHGRGGYEDRIEALRSRRNILSRDLKRQQKKYDRLLGKVAELATAAAYVYNMGWWRIGEHLVAAPVQKAAWARLRDALLEAIPESVRKKSDNPLDAPPVDTGRLRSSMKDALLSALGPPEESHPPPNLWTKEYWDAYLAGDSHRMREEGARMHQTAKSNVCGVALEPAEEAPSADYRDMAMSETERLAEFLMEEIPAEIGEGSAVDNAIRLLRSRPPAPPSVDEVNMGIFDALYKHLHHRVPGQETAQEANSTETATEPRFDALEGLTAILMVLGGRVEVDPAEGRVRFIMREGNTEHLFEASAEGVAASAEGAEEIARVDEHGNLSLTGID
jgi:hypothetical protein